jgi:hypothetical protein
MLRIVGLEAIKVVLLHLQGVVDLQQRGDPLFVSEAKRWLSEMEKALGGSRLPAAGEVTALRSVLLSAERGAVPEGVEVAGRPGKRKTAEAAAAYVLRRVTEIVSATIARDQERVAEGQRMMLQLLALARAKGIDRTAVDREAEAPTPEARWRVLSMDPDLKAGTVNIEGLVGHEDALVLLDALASENRPK